MLHNEAASSSIKRTCDDNQLPDKFRYEFILVEMDRRKKETSMSRHRATKRIPTMVACLLMLVWHLGVASAASPPAECSLLTLSGGYVWHETTTTINADHNKTDPLKIYSNG